MSELKN